jgi:integrase
MTAILTGLRASELRGLRWEDVDLKKAELHVRQRADRYQAIGKPKSEAGERAVPLPSKLVAVLREWKLKCPGRDTGKRDARRKPIRELHLVFPNGEGNVLWHTNIIQDGLIPTQIAAGVTVPALDSSGKPKSDDEGKPARQAKYTGLHALRHFYASWCINRKVDGGLELPAKVVQERMGHSSITVTLDTYGHLFPRGDDGAEMARAEATLLG